MNNKFIPCRKCCKLPGPQPGYYYLIENGYTVAKECDCHKKWVKDNQITRELSISNLNCDYTFDDYKGKVSLQSLQALKKLSENFDKYSYKKMFYVYGPNGTQKTSMVTALGKQLVLQGYTVQYTLLNTLMNSLIIDFDETNTEAKKAFSDRCLNVDFLIIDEAFDSSKSTVFKSGYQIPYLDAFLRSRFEMGKKDIMFISNKKQNEIEAQGFGVSIQNFVERNTKQSTLQFKDAYILNANDIDPLGIFKDE